MLLENQQIGEHCSVWTSGFKSVQQCAGLQTAFRNYSLPVDIGI